MKILLADDHTLFRDALLSYIERAEPGASVILAEDMHQARDRLMGDGPFDLVLLDWRMPGVTGLHDMTAMMHLYPNTRFALMSGVVEEDDARAALDAGMWGYFPKTLSGRVLVKGLQQIMRGEKFIPINENDALQPSYQAEKYFYNPAVAKNDMGLTDRETETLILLAQGKTNAEIGTALGIQEVTVKLHVRNIYDKLGVRNRTEAAMKAYEKGIVK